MVSAGIAILKSFILYITHKLCKPGYKKNISEYQYTKLICS